MYPRRFARVRPAGKGSSSAKLIVGPKDPLIDCTVVDYSPGGACLEVFGQPRLPNRFELVFGGTTPDDVWGSLFRRAAGPVRRHSEEPTRSEGYEYAHCSPQLAQ